MKLGRKFLYLLAGAGALLVILVFPVLKRPPASLSLDYESHVTVPAITRMIFNDRMVLMRSQKGRNEIGAIEYLPGQGDKLIFQLWWYDILAEQAYVSSFDLRASELSLLGGGGLADLTIVVGPGADVSATTINPEVGKLIGRGMGGQLPTLDEAPDVVLLAACAEPVPPEDPVSVELADAALETSGNDQFRADLSGREGYLARYGEVVARCPAGGTW